MVDPSDRLRDFEAKLQRLKARMETGLSERIGELRDAAARLLAGDEAARRELKRVGHKLRGIAGTYGHQTLTDLAGELQNRASLSPPATLSATVEAIAAEAERVLRGAAGTMRADLQPPAAPAPRPGPPPTATAPGGARARVLAMDDDANTVKLLQLTLEQVGGFDATLVGSAGEALALLRAQRYELVISDAMMPDMNGREFLRAARQLGGDAAEVPIVILSAATPDELGWQDAAAEASAWLRKPFRPQELVEALKRVMLEGRAPRPSPK